MNPDYSRLSRRAMLKLTTLAGAATISPLQIFGQSRPVREDVARTITDYLQTLARSDGGYAWGDQEISHLTPTLGVVGSCHVMRPMPPHKDRLAEYVRTHHPREVKKLEQERRIFDYQQVQALTWLGADASDFKPKISALTKPLGYLKQYERHGYPVFQSELGAVMSHSLLGLPTAGIAGAFGSYIDVRRRPNGSFNNTPAADGGDGHVMNTLWALQALGVLQRQVENKDALIAWLRSCQLPSGGFTYQPKPEFGGVDDIAYTRAAVKALKLLGAAPAKLDACVAQIHSLANADGGFSDRAGWLSNATATWYALDALDTLGALDSLRAVKRRPLRARMPLPAGLKVFSLQLESHGQGCPAEAVDLAQS